MFITIEQLSYLLNCCVKKRGDVKLILNSFSNSFIVILLKRLSLKTEALLTKMEHWGNCLNTFDTRTLILFGLDKSYLNSLQSTPHLLTSLDTFLAYCSEEL